MLGFGAKFMWNFCCPIFRVKQASKKINVNISLFTPLYFLKVLDH